MLEVRVESDVCIMKVLCEVTVASLEALKKEIEENLKEDYKGYILNLDSCTYMHSKGFEYIVELYKAIKKQKKKLVITNMVQDVKKLFEITKIDAIIETYKIEKEALDSMK